MPYYVGYTDYIANKARPDAPGEVTWTQSLLINNYAEPKYIVIDKEIKGGVHRVKYRSQLYLSSYDGIFTPRRVKGMLCYVEYEDDDTPCGKYYSLKLYPGTSADQWVEVGSGANVIINNPKTVANLDARTALETIPLVGTATTAAGNSTVNGSGTNWGVDLLVGDKFRFGDRGYDPTLYVVQTITNTTSLKTTVNTLAHNAETLYKQVVQPGDFVNVADARTPEEVEADIEPYSASYIWDGTQWLTVYPYGGDPYSHVQNTDTGIIIDDAFVSGDTIWNTIMNVDYRKLYNDAETLENAAQGADVNGNGPNAFSSKRIASELLVRPATDIENGKPDLFLNQVGQWIAPTSSGGGGTPIETGDILGGGGADPNYFI